MRGADWRSTRSERSSAPGVQTAAGTWAVNEAEAAYIESSVNADDAWGQTLADKAEWTNKPVQPPGLGRWVPHALTCLCSGLLLTGALHAPQPDGEHAQAEML